MNLEGKQQSLLTFRVGPVLCCAPSFPVQSIIIPPKLTHPPGTDSSQPGIFKHGSHIVKVFDLRQKFGVEQSEWTQPGNLIVTLLKEESIAFWVDQILDVFDFPSKGWGNLPAAIPRGVFSRTLLLNKKIHLYSEFENLSTIHDLDYLKNYIQQLKQQDGIDDTKQKKESTLKNITVEPREPKESKEHKEPSTKNIIKEKTADKNINTIADKNITLSSSQVTLNKKHDIPSTVDIKKTFKTIPIRKPSVDAKEIPKKHLERKPSTFVEKRPTERTLTTIEDKEESSIFPVVFFFIFIMLFFAAGVYYLFINTVSKDYKKTEKQTSYQKTVEIKEKTPLKDIISNQTSIDFEVEKTDEIINTKEKVNNIELVPEEDKNNSIIKKPEDAAYQAKIIQQDNDITITLRHSKQERKQQEIIPPVQKLKDEPVVQAITAAPATKKDKIKQSIKSQKVSHEIIHIVVKGDTLWAIAKKHVNNPFLYPELARLSKIKNPHRIYPGNRVRIRFIED